MKLTINQLKQIIREELMEAYKHEDFVGAGGPRMGARRRAGIDSELMGKLKTLGGGQEIELARSLGSEEHGPLDMSTPSLWYQILKFAIPRVKDEIGYWIFNDMHHNAHEQADWVERNGYKLLINPSSPKLLSPPWKPLFVTEDQLVGIIMKYSRHDIMYNLETRPKQDEFFAHWMKAGSSITKRIRQEINNFVNDGALKLDNGIFYVNMYDERYGNYP